MFRKNIKKCCAVICAAVLLVGVCLSAAADTENSWDISGIGQNLDLAWLESYVNIKEEQWQISQTEKMVAAGIPEDSIHYILDSSHDGMEKQILCMMAVYRGYDFYNRVACTTYIDNLYHEMHTYRITGGKAEKTMVSSAVSVMKLLKAFCPGGSADFDSFAESAEDEISVTVFSGSVTAEEIYAADSDWQTVPDSWAGWTEDKIEECTELLAMDDAAREQAFSQRQRESLLDSPAPLYKQGAAEWYQEPFGNGTLMSDACCPTAIAMAISGITGQRITPSEIAARYNNDDYRDPSAGAYGAAMCNAAANDYGIPHEAGRDMLTADEIVYALQNGAMIVMSMTPAAGTFASVFHYVTLTGLTADGQIIVNNPGSFTDITYNDISVILNNQSGRGYGIFFPSEEAHEAYEDAFYPASESEEE